VSPDNLQRQLADRDELIQELTRQLEQAAEQLDRFQRSGGVTGRSAPAIPADFLKQQELIGQDVAFLVTEWENSQLAGSMGRLELQLQELRDLVTRSVAAEPVRNPSRDSLVSDVWKSEATHSREADLLHSLQEALTQQEEIPELELPDTLSPRNTSAGSDTDYLPPRFENVPAPVDFESADKQILKLAVEERDQFIRELFEEYRTLHQNRSLQTPLNWEELTEFPDELREAVTQLQRQLQDQLRLGEVSMSIERARLAREATQIEAARTQLEKQLKQQGLDARHLQGLEFLATQEKGKGHPTESPRTQKWLNMLRIRDT